MTERGDNGYHVPMRSYGLVLLPLLVACAAGEPAPQTPAPSPAPVTVKPPEPAAAPTEGEAATPEADPNEADPNEAPPSEARPSHTLADISLTFELPSDAWKKHPGLGKVADGASYIGFERDDVFDAQGHAVRPYCGITSEPAPGVSDLVMYSMSWRMRVPFHVDEVFTHEDGKIQLKNAIGYRGKVTSDGIEHTLLVLHGLFRERGFVVVCDATTSVFDQVQGELETFLASLRHTADP